MPKGPLEGVRVLDLSRLLPGGFCSLILAQLGAEVVKVEDTGAGDYLRHFPPLKGGMGGAYYALNRGKRSICINLKRPEGKALLLRMLPRFRVVLEGFRPGTMDRLGLGYETLKEAHPEVVLCSISGYGQTGPMAHRAGHDLTYMSLAGTLAAGGEPGGKPAQPGIQVADLAGGALWPAVRILAALMSSEGCHLDVSMTEGALSMLLPALGDLAFGAEPLRRGTGLLNGGAGVYRPYATADGGHLAVAPIEPKFWQALGAAPGGVARAPPPLAPAERQAEISAALEQTLSSKDRDTWTEELAPVDACVEPVLEMEELADHPQHQARGAFVTTEDPERGPITLPALPMEGELPDSPAPGQGEHTEEVLREAGLGLDEIDALRKDAVIR